LGKVAFFRACTALMAALRASFTEGLFALEFCLVARIYFWICVHSRSLPRLCSNVSSLFSQLPACQCTLFRVCFR